MMEGCCFHWPLCGGLCDTKQPAGVFAGRVHNLLRGNPLDLRKLLGDQRQQGGVVALSTMRLGGHIGAVGFEQNAFEREDGGGLERAARGF